MTERCNFIERKRGGFNCGSYAFNLAREGINQDGLCDTHYWQVRCEKAESQLEKFAPCEVKKPDAKAAL